MMLRHRALQVSLPIQRKKPLNRQTTAIRTRTKREIFGLRTKYYVATHYIKNTEHAETFSETLTLSRQI